MKPARLPGRAGFGTCRKLTVDLPDRPAAQLELAAHRVSADFEAEPIAGALTDLRGGAGRAPIALDRNSGRTKLAVPRGPQRWQLQLP
ncbi:MAG: hypothetical protein AAF495_12265 [Pseudomonadota bacterium]